MRRAAQRAEELRPQRLLHGRGGRAVLARKHGRLAQKVVHLLVEQAGILVVEQAGVRQVAHLHRHALRPDHRAHAAQDALLAQVIQLAHKLAAARARVLPLPQLPLQKRELLFPRARGGRGGRLGKRARRGGAPAQPPAHGAPRLHGAMIHRFIFLLLSRPRLTRN